jgi:nucleotide-binding universal stress UspA family protein
MTRYPSLLCPVDFSEASRAALAQSAAIANHFGAALTVMTVIDPLAAALAASDPTFTRPDVESEEALRRYCDATLAHTPPGPRRLALRQTVGTPATEIARAANESHADLIVMSSHGHRGLRKLVFGSTTERVLRQTRVPVLVTPGASTEAVPVSELAAHIREIVAPVDLTAASPHQINVASAIAEAMALPLMLMHMLPPLVPASGRSRTPAPAAAAGLERARSQLHELQSAITPRVQTESLVLFGEPSEEIVRIAESRAAGLIVMGLHSSGVLGPRMGSVTYRVLRATNAFVLALPPVATATASGTAASTRVPA